MQRDSEAEIVDVSGAYHLWADLFDYGIRMALSTVGDSPEEKAEARERFLCGWKRALEERDAMLLRMLSRRQEGQHGQ